MLKCRISMKSCFIWGEMERSLLEFLFSSSTSPVSFSSDPGVPSMPKMPGMNIDNKKIIVTMLHFQ